MESGDNYYAVIRRAAVAVMATEAAAFSLDGDGKTLTPVCHIRPDAEATPAVMRSAIKAFEDMIRPCLDQGKDGTYEVGHATRLKKQQYCLVVLTRRSGHVDGAVAFIVRCADRDAASISLRLARCELAPYLNRASGGGSEEPPDR